GLTLSTTPAATREEILELFQLSATWKRPVFVHLRDDAGPYEILQEVIADAAISGAPLHILHINTFLGNTPRALHVIDLARSHGLDVTTEALAYNSATLFIESSTFDPGWQQRLHLDYADLTWAVTGERLTADSFERYRKQGGRVIAFLNKEETVRNAVAYPNVAIASDGNILEGGKGHPRGAGTFAPVLGRYFREETPLSLM